jgi:ABC-type multidrug transport system ATPase subunit
MDSSTALKIIHHFRDLSKHRGATIIVKSLSSLVESTDAFEKVTVLCRRQQISFGTWADRLRYFHSLGFQIPTQMKTEDFFTALTNPAEAQLLTRDGMGSQVPVTERGIQSLMEGEQ